MLKVTPDYYKDFKCIADKCRHNCCIGWAIELDSATLELYEKVGGEIGRRLQKTIGGDPPAFILKSNGRCPFLNEHNLCDIITDLGSDYLCPICAEHPRFYNHLPSRIEVGLGLSCEAAARLILSQPRPMTLNLEGEADSPGEIIELRDGVIALLQDRSLPLKARIEKVHRKAKTPMVSAEKEMIDFFLSLERLDEEWTRLLETVREENPKSTIPENMETAAEQFAVYMIYRHVAAAEDMNDALLRISFSFLCLDLLLRVCNTFGEDFSFDVFSESSRMLSAEIEYSDENLFLILDEIAFKGI